jgi:hypothetical protein
MRQDFRQQPFLQATVETACGMFFFAGVDADRLERESGHAEQADWEFRSLLSDATEIPT